MNEPNMHEAVFTAARVVNGGEPILYVTHDSDDGAWQLLPGNDISMKEAMVVGWETMLEIDPSVKELFDLPEGWKATRKAVGAPWVRSKRD